MQRIVSIVISLVAAGMVCCSAVLAETDPEKVVLFPFNTEKAGKYSVLKDALTNMVAGRLASLENVDLVENILNPEEEMRFVEQYPEKSDEVFEKLGAERIGAGRIEHKGERLILQMTFFNASRKPPIVIQAQAENEQVIMATIDRLLAKINSEVFIADSPQATDKPLLTQSEGMDAFKTEHPDRKYKKEIVFGSAVFTDETGATVSRQNILRRTSSLPAGLVGLAEADVDQDGQKEIIVASQTDIRAYRYDRGIIKQIGRAGLRRDVVVHAMSLADLDGDGKSEIYISAVRDPDLSSAIYTWEENIGFTEVVSKIPWAIRPLEVPEQGLVLLGQRESTDVTVYLEQGIYPLQVDFSAGKVQAGERLPLPGAFNLFDFVYGDIDGDGVWEKIVVTSQMKLAVYDFRNRIIWLSEEDYGGNMAYLGKRWRGKEGRDYYYMTNDDENYMELQYLPVRLIARDVNDDGNTDIIAVKNRLSTFKVLPNLRSFKGGSSVCLSWNGSKMTELWQTDTLDGYIADVYFDNKSSNSSDIFGSSKDNDPEGVRLMLGQVPNDGFANFFNFFGSESKLVVYEFKIVKESAEKSDSK